MQLQTLELMDIDDHAKNNNITIYRVNCVHDKEQYYI